MSEDSLESVLNDTLENVLFYYEEFLMSCPLHYLNRCVVRRLKKLSPVIKVKVGPYENERPAKLIDLILEDPRFHARKNSKNVWNVAPASVLEDTKSNIENYNYVMRLK